MARLTKLSPDNARRKPARPSLYRTIFPQLTFLLPEDEAAQLRLELETDMARLEAI